MKKRRISLADAYEAYRANQFTPMDFVEAVDNLFEKAGLALDDETRETICKLDCASDLVLTAYDGNNEAIDRILDEMWHPIAETVADKVEFLLGK